jgi:hypothetical protein
VTAVACDLAPPTVTLANRDGLVEVRRLGDAARSCGSIHVGDYVDVEGQKVNEQLYEATDISAKRPGR